MTDHSTPTRLEVRHYRALRELIDFHKGADNSGNPEAEATLATAHQALVALRERFPEFEAFERSLVGTTPDGGVSRSVSQE